MLKKTVTYEDYNGNEKTKDCYFNLSVPEIIELEVSTEEGIVDFLENVIRSKDPKELIGQFKRFVLLSYGEKSADGESFMKSDGIRAKFEHSPAYEEVFMELATSDDAAAEFVNNVISRKKLERAASMIEQAAKRAAETGEEVANILGVKNVKDNDTEAGTAG